MCRIVKNTRMFFCLWCRLHLMNWNTKWLDELKYQMHKEWEILRFYNLFLQFKFILYFSYHTKNIFLTTLITFKRGRRHLLNGITHAYDKCVVWPLPHLLSSPPYFVYLLITKMKNCTFIWFLYLIYFLYF